MVPTLLAGARRLLIASALVSAVWARADVPAESAVAAALDSWHRAAATADEERYFALMTRDAVFLGTDERERWTGDEFRKWAHPFFARGKAWSFKPTTRHVFVSTDGKVAWFDEALDTPNLGPCRGSGVLVLEQSGWKIAQYNLSVPIPNGLMGEIKRRIEEYSRKPAAPH